MNFSKLIFLSLYLMAEAVLAQCQDSTIMLDQMQERYVELLNKNGESILLKVKVADDASERAAGFQHICPQRIESTAILFIFGRANKPVFHMNNVYADLDIAFIDEQGLIGDIQLMREHINSGQGQLYPSQMITKYALEVYQGFFEKNNIEVGNSYLKADD